MLFICSVSVLFQWLEDKHSILQTVSFVDDIGLLVECHDIGKGPRQLERIAKDTMKLGSDNKVDFEVSKRGVATQQTQKVPTACERTHCSHRRAIVDYKARSVKVARLLAGSEAVFQNTL